MSDELDFYIVDDIPEYVFIITDDEEQEEYIALKGEDGSFKYEKVTELPATGKDGVLYLVPKSYTEQTASGNPISINVTEGAGKLTDLKLDGDASQQTYTGKNLIAPSSIHNGAFTSKDQLINDQYTETGNTKYRSIKIDNLPAGTYTFSIQWDTTARILRAVYDDSLVSITTDRNSYTFTTATSGLFGITFRNINSTDFLDDSYTVQLETGSSPSDHEPYVGGKASPSPDYSQSVNDVTGTQTIDINGTSYPISLGNIELLEIDTYRDYIYKSGADWYIKKQTGKIVLDGTEDGWGKSGVANTNNYYCTGVTDAANISTVKKGAISPTLPSLTLNQMLATTSRYGVALYNTGVSQIRVCFPIDELSTVAQVKTWLSSHPTTVYYILATPTDTKITDANLIAQLEAVRTAQLANGTNAISNTATGSKLAGDLELKYYEYDPTNRYNKWLWINADAAYEQM